MPTVEASRSHDLTPTQARATVEKLARSYQQRFGGDYHWQDGVLHFEAQGTSGHIHVDDSLVHVTIELGTMMWPIKGQVQAAVEHQLDEHLTAS